MPTYLYECNACNQQFEVEQRITADPLDECNCGSKGTVKRLIQPIAVMFKGSGFYVNDYSGSSGGATKNADATPSCGTDGAGCACNPAAES